MPKATFFNLPDDKRARIVELAIDEFAAHPFRQASLSRIVARAGIAKGSMYQYFENKLDLFRWLIFDHVGQKKLAYLADAEPPEGLFDQLESMVVAGTRFLLDNPALGRLAQSIVEPSSDPQLRALSRDILAQGHAYMCARVEAAQARGEVRDDLDAELIAHVLRVVIGQGVIDVLLARLGVDLFGLLEDPQIARRISEAQLRALIRDVLAFVRGGIAAA